MGEKTKRVVLDKKKLKGALVQMAEKEVEVPELNKLMGLGDGEVAVVKIRQLNLDEYLTCQQMSDDRVKNLIEGVLAAAEKRGEVEEEILASYNGLSGKTQYYIDICLKGVVEPKLVRTHWVFMAGNYPLVMEKLASQIILLTKGGADLKKNS